jgi:glutaredoxin
MNGLGQKIFSGILILACAGMLLLDLKREPQVVGEEGFTGASYSEVEAFDAQKMFEDLGGKPGETPVVLFVASWCSVCKALEGQLSKRGVSYLRADVEQSREAYLYFKSVAREANSSVVPLTMVGNKRFIGYKPGEIEEAIRELKFTTSAQAV